MENLPAIRNITGYAVCANCGVALAADETYVCEPCCRTFEWLSEIETAEKFRTEEQE